MISRQYMVSQLLYLLANAEADLCGTEHTYIYSFVFSHSEHFCLYLSAFESLSIYMITKLFLHFASTFCFADVLRYMTLDIFTDILSRHRGVLWIGRLQV